MLFLRAEEYFVSHHPAVLIGVNLVFIGEEEEEKRSGDAMGEGG